MGEEKEEGNENEFYSSYKEGIEGQEKDNIEDPLREDRLRRQKEQQEDEAALKEMEGEGDEARLARARQDAKNRKIAELKLLKSRKRNDPNNPSKEELDAQQSLEQLTWKDRWENDAKMKQVFTSSKLVGKAKMKMKVAAMGGASGASSGDTKDGKDQEKEKEQAAAAAEDEAAKPVEDDTVEELPGVIKSVDEYATILGKKVTELTETKFQPPEVSESEGEEESGGEDEGDLWGDIMGS